MTVSKPTPPMMTGLPVLGNVLDFLNDRPTLLTRGYQEHGSVFAIKLGPKPVAVLASEEAREAFFTHTDTALRMDKAYTFLRATFGDIAFTAPPETYYAQRHVIHAPFKGSKMAGYVRVMGLEVQQWLDSLGDSGELDLTKALIPLIQNVAAHAIMGPEFRQRMGREFWDLYTDLSRALDPVLPPHLPLPKFIRRDRAKVKMRQMLTPIIEERRTTTAQHDDMLQEFATATYKDGRPVESEAIIGIIMGLMFAGHETTLGQTAWTIVELLRHPDYLQKVQAEIAQVLPQGKPMDVNTLAQLQHVMWAVHETTRTHPSADMIMRYVEEEIEVGEYRIPAGWMALLSSTVAQNLPEIFTNPEKFDPLRFAPGREEDKGHRHPLTGFGGGVHKCTGMNFANNEMTVITSLLFQQFDVELVTPQVETSYSEGASRPKKAIIRYKRKPQTEVSREVMEQAAAAGCPHMSKLIEEQ